MIVESLSRLTIRYNNSSLQSEKIDIGKVYKQIFILLNIYYLFLDLF